MPVTQAQINRINQLARKSKAEGLTAEEKEEQAKLRRLYIDAMKESLRGQLDNTYIVDVHGNKRKLPKKKPARKRLVRLSRPSKRRIRNYVSRKRKNRKNFSRSKRRKNVPC